PRGGRADPAPGAAARAPVRGAAVSDAGGTVLPAEVAARVARAAPLLATHVRHTPLLASTWLSAATGGEVRLKLENLQCTGSFKGRGATHAVAQLSVEQRRAGVVTASSGNHGLGVAAAARQFGAPALVFVPSTTPGKKRERIRAAGAEVEVF